MDIQSVQAEVEKLFSEFGSSVLLEVVHVSKAGNEVTRAGNIEKLHDWGMTLAVPEKGYRSIRYDSITSCTIA